MISLQYRVIHGPGPYHGVPCENSGVQDPRNPSPPVNAPKRKGKDSPYSTTERRVPELIPVLGSQPAGDVSHKPGGRLPLLFARPAVTPATLKRAATDSLITQPATNRAVSVPNACKRNSKDRAVMILQCRPIAAESGV